MSSKLADAARSSAIPIASLIIILFSISLFISLSGCIQRAGVGGQAYVDQYKTDIKRLAISDPSMYEECKLGKCRCMACKNGTNIFGPMRDLIGGYCYWDYDCNQQKKSDLDNPTKSPDVRIRQFMVGQGPTFADFAIAQPYCNNRMSMAVQWLVGGQDTNYTLPSAERSMCFLGMDIIPVYVLYSKGLNLNADRTKQIAKILGNDGSSVFMGRLSNGPVGPVVVVTEMDFNLSMAGQVAAEVQAINDYCHNDRAGGKIYCQVAVAPKINDFAALNAVMAAAGPENIDLVAYGINGHYVNSCDGSKINQQALNFSRYILYNWSKPSIIPYVMFEPVGNDSNNTCTWNEEKVIRAYGTTFQNIQSLVGVGVIGISPYSFNSTTYNISNPLGCQDCAIAKSPERMNAWYSGCQQYTVLNRANVMNPGGGNAILFPDQPGGSCLSDASQLDYVFRGMKFADVMGNKDIMNPLTAPMKDKEEQLYSCSECISRNASVSSRPPFSFNVMAKPSQDLCEKIVEIEQWASLRNLDPAFVRAVVNTESGFDKCAAAKVCSKQCLGDPGCSQGCFMSDNSGNSECYSKAYDEMHDPRSKTDPPNACPDFPSATPDPSGTRPLDWRYCAVGLMQSLEPPYTFWPDQYLSPDMTPGVDNPYKDVFQRSGFWAMRNNPSSTYEIPEIVSARGCNPKFNPFDPSDSLCMGTLKLEKMIRYGHAWIASHSGELGFSDTGADTEKSAVFAAYIASNMYTGFWLASSRKNDPISNAHPSCGSGMSNGECWAFAYSQSRDITPDYCSNKADGTECKDKKPRWEPPFYCYGASVSPGSAPDFVAYVRDCWDYFNYRPDSGAVKMGQYYGFVQCDNSFCPYGKKLASKLGQTLPLSGNPYVPNPANPQATVPVTPP
jgi:hypothetical protein